MFMLKISLHPTEGCILIDKHLFTSRFQALFSPIELLFANTVHPPARHQQRLVCAPAGIKEEVTLGRTAFTAGSPIRIPSPDERTLRALHPTRFRGKGNWTGSATFPSGKGHFPGHGFAFLHGKPRPLGRERGGAASPRGAAHPGPPGGSLSPRRAPTAPRPPPAPRDPACRPRPAHPRPGGEPLTMAVAVRSPCLAGRSPCLAGRSRLHAPAFAPTPAARRVALPSRPRRAGLRGGPRAGAMAEPPGQPGRLGRAPGPGPPRPVPALWAPCPLARGLQRPLRAAGV